MVINITLLDVSNENPLVSNPSSNENNNPDHSADTLTVIHLQLLIHQRVLLIAQSFGLRVIAHCSTEGQSCEINVLFNLE